MGLASRSIFIALLLQYYFIFSNCCIKVSRLTEDAECTRGSLNVPKYKYPEHANDFDGSIITIKYKPTALLQKHTIMNSPMFSACMKCGICIVVSEKLEEILTFANKSCVPLNEYNDDMAFDFFRPICNYSFHSYGLKEWHGLRVLSQYLFLDNVPNSMDGLWSGVLEESCHFYLNHFGDRNLIKVWLSNDKVNVTTLLCRNDGLFRDCMNLNQGVMTIEFRSKFFSSGSTVQVNYPCV